MEAASVQRVVVPAPPLNLEDLYAMAIDAKLEVTLKFTTLPNARPSGPGKMAFALKTQDGQFVTAEVSTKAWNKLVKAADEWPAWTAALSGTMGERTEKGFALATPGLQVFERQPKALTGTTPSVGNKPVLATAAEPPVQDAVLPAADLNVSSPQIGKPKLSLKRQSKSD